MNSSWINKYNQSYHVHMQPEGLSCTGPLSGDFSDIIVFAMQDADHNNGGKHNGPATESRFDHWQNLWAPWRMEYIDSLSEKDEGCFLCNYRDNPEKDDTQLVMLRRKNCFCLMNRFPYTGGHLLIAPYEHLATMDELCGETLRELMELCRDSQIILRNALYADGFNVGFNVGRGAGAGLPGHIHMHVVPRWDGDTNFMTVLGDIRVIPQSMDAIRDRINSSALKLGFK